MLLILASPHDQTALGLAEAATHHGIPVLCGNPMVPLSAVFDVHQFSGVFNRLHFFSLSRMLHLKKSDISYAHQEWLAAALSFLRAHPNCINAPLPPHMLGQHVGFMTQFSWASDCGLCPPAYCITNDLREAKDFCDQHERKIIVRNNVDTYRDFARSSHRQLNFQKAAAKLHYLVEWPEGVPHFYHRVDDRVYFAEGVGCAQKKRKLSDEIRIPLENLSARFNTRFLECLLFQRDDGSWMFGYISSYPELERYRAHEVAIHKRLLDVLSPKRSRKKQEAFIPKCLRPRVGVKNI